MKGAVVYAAAPFVHSLFVHDGDRSSFACPDADGIVQAVDEDLAVARFACLADFLGDFDDFVDRHFTDDRFDFDAWQEVDVVPLAAVDFDVAFLEAAAEDLADSHAHDTDVVLMKITPNQWIEIVKLISTFVIGCSSIRITSISYDR